MSCSEDNIVVFEDGMNLRLFPEA